MSSRVQIALVKQLNRQFKMVDDHFDERRDEIVIGFENYREQIVDAIAINKTRFDLCIDEKIETIVDYDYIINHDEIVDDTDDVAKRLYSVQNSLLFFGSLYPTTNKNSRNTDFYWFLFGVLAYMCSVLH